MPDALRLAVVATHPVQYYAPLYRRLAAEPGVDLEVLFAHRPTAEDQGRGFGVAFQWDVDLTSGYEHRWLRNTAKQPSASTFDGCDTPEVADVVRDGGYDAVLLMGWHAKSYWQAMRGARAGRVPMLVRGDSHLADDRLPKRLVKRMLYPIFLSRFAACLSVGTRSDEYFRYYGARRVVRSSHFVDNAFFASRAEALVAERVALRAAWGLDDDALVLLFAGKLVPQKRPIDLVRAVARSGRSDVQALVAGAGALAAEMEQEAERLGVKLTIAGFQNQTEMPRAYAAADALVLPSEQETWGLVVNEAMASGRPVVVTDMVGCGPDLVHDGETGHRYPVADVDALGRTIATMAADRAATARMGTAARALIERYDVEAAVAGVLEAARTAAAERGR